MSCLQGDRRQVSPQFRCGNVRTGRRRWARTTVKSETPHVNVQSPQNEFWWSIRRSDVSCQASVSHQEIPHTIQHRAPRKFFCGHGESLAKVKIFFLAKHFRSWKKEVWSTTIYDHLRIILELPCVTRMTLEKYYLKNVISQIIKSWS